MPKEQINTKADEKVYEKGPYGIAKLPREDRTAYGLTLQGDTIIQVIKYRLAQPLASQEAIAEMSGLGQSTVAAALSTPYAKRELAAIQQDTRTMAQELYKGQGDSITYWNRSVVKGLVELEKDSANINPAILLNAREATRDISKGTGLHKDTLRIEQGTTAADDYAQLEELASDPDIATFLIIDEGEGESPTTPAQVEGGIIPVSQKLSEIDLTDDQVGLPEGSELAQQDDQGESESAEPTS